MRCVAGTGEDRQVRHPPADTPRKPDGQYRIIHRQDQRGSPAEVEAVADRMIIIGGGRIQAQGTRAELLPGAGPIVEPEETGLERLFLELTGVSA